VIRTRATSWLRPPATTRSAVAVASPAPTKSTSGFKTNRASSRSGFLRAGTISPSLARNEARRSLHHQAKSLFDGTSARGMKNTPIARKKSVARMSGCDKYVLSIDSLHTELE